MDFTNTDAYYWAKEFNKTAQNLGYPEMDEDWLMGWFANAIMAGYDSHARKVTLAASECSAALAGAIEVLGDIGNLSHAKTLIDEFK